MNGREIPLTTFQTSIHGFLTKKMQKIKPNFSKQKESEQLLIDVLKFYISNNHQQTLKVHIIKNMDEGCNKLNLAVPSNDVLNSWVPSREKTRLVTPWECARSRRRKHWPVLMRQTYKNAIQIKSRYSMVSVSEILIMSFFHIPCPRVCILF